MTDSFKARTTLNVAGREYEIYRLDAVQSDKLARLPRDPIREQAPVAAERMLPPDGRVPPGRKTAVVAGRPGRRHVI